MHSKWLVAAIAFAFHQPGVRLLLGLRQQPATRRLNAIFLGATIVGTLAVWLSAASEDRAVMAVVAFTAGHFTWSSVFAWLVVHRLDAALLPADAAPR